jgi:NAD(P)-dependent dehydrogenase (short-subunit alcohol dehydrogenase family)
LYPTSKGAVVNMTRAMAAHHASMGIRVNCVCPGAYYRLFVHPCCSAHNEHPWPGMLYTPMVYARGIAPEVREARRQRGLLKTEGNGWDCGCAVRFLVSDEARWMTGVILPVDAGSTAAAAGQSGKMSSTLAGGVGGEHESQDSLNEWLS